MGRAAKLPRILTALLISIGFNTLTFGLGALGHPEEKEPAIWRALHFVETPCTLVGEWLFPLQGHSLKTMLPVIVCLIVYWAGLAWVIITLVAWLRASLHHREQKM